MASTSPPFHGSIVVAATGSRAAPSSSDSFSVLEPALTTRTRSPTRPDPVLHLRQVVADLADVVPVPVALVDHLLVDERGLPAEPVYPVDHVHHEVVAVEVVHHHHVERGRRGALFDVAAHVDVAVIRAAVGEPVDEPRVAVIGE